MTSSVNQPFLAAIQLFVDGSKQEIDEAVRRTRLAGLCCAGDSLPERVRY